MKFSIDKHYLVDPLKQVASALPSKAIIPILSGILFEVDINGLKMTAGNTHMFICAVVEPDYFELNKSGSIVLPGSTVLEIVQKSSSDLTFEVKGTEVVIKTSSNKFKLNGIEPDDFPSIPPVEGNAVTLFGDSFKKLIKKTIFAVAEDKTSLPIITGVNIEFLDGLVRATATDRSRLARAELISESTHQLSTVISGDSLSTLMKIAPDSEIEFRIGDYGFVALMKGMTFYSRVLEGHFPDVERLIRTNYKFNAIFNTKEMLLALENVEIVAKEEKVKKAKITITNGLLVESNTTGGNAAVSVALEDIQGEGYSMSFNIKFFIDALKSLNSERTIINLNGKLDPIVLLGYGDDSSRHIILPYRTPGE